MRRWSKILLAVSMMGIVFGMIYYLTLPRVELPESAEVSAALTTLHEYGFESTQITNEMDYAHLLVCFVGFLLAIVIYFGIDSTREKKKILRTVEYVRKMNQRVYDLKPDEEAEDELSLLTNELYKTTVLLQETAELDRRRAKNLEIALADISHQLRTPLTSLQITLDNLYDNPDLDVKTRREFLRTAGRQAEQMSELVVTLLNLAKLDNGTLKMKPQEITAGDLLAGVVDNLKVLAELEDVKLQVAGELMARLRVDKKWQTEALTNIAKNCIEHSAPGQTVQMRVESSAIFTKIVISDSGDGIPAGEVRHVFERFYKAKNARAESVGIGLAFAKTVIEADGGQVRVRSRVGEGTRFVVSYTTWCVKEAK